MPKIFIFLFAIDMNSSAIFAAESDEFIHSANKFIAKRWRLLNQSVDSYFSNQNYSTSTLENRSRLFLTSSLYKKEGRDLENEFDFQLRVDFPKTAKRLKIVVEREQNDIANAINPTPSKKISTTKNTVKDKKRKYTAGVGLIFKETEHYQGAASFGLRLDVPLNPFIKLSFKRNFVFSKLTLSLAQQFNLYRQEGFQEISQVTFGRKLNKIFELNLVNTLAWADETDRFDLRNNLLLFQSLGEEKMLTYSIGANAKLSPTFYYSNYDFSLGLRQLLYGKWLYGSLVLGADYVKDNGFKQERYIQGSIDIFFKE